MPALLKRSRGYNVHQLAATDAVADTLTAIARFRLRRPAALRPTTAPKRSCQRQRDAGPGAGDERDFLIGHPACG
jgi:hypothetical protein